MRTYNLTAGCGKIKAKEFEITGAGVFQSTKGLSRTGISLLVVSLLALFAVCIQLFFGIDMSFPLLFVVIAWVAVAISNMFIGSKLASENFKEGRIQEVIVLDTKQDYNKYVAFVELDGECSDHDDLPDEPRSV